MHIRDPDSKLDKVIFDTNFDPIKYLRHFDSEPLDTIVTHV